MKQPWGMKNEKGSKARSRWEDIDLIIPTLGTLMEGGRQEHREEAKSWGRGLGCLESWGYTGPQEEGPATRWLRRSTC